MQYNKNNKDLCLKKNGTKPQNIYQFISETYSEKTCKLLNNEIYYILKNKKLWHFV